MRRQSPLSLAESFQVEPGLSPTTLESFKAEKRAQEFWGSSGDLFSAVGVTKECSLEVEGNGTPSDKLPGA